MGLRLLCVVAHPDDECFAFGGALALASEQGVETDVVCLTDGGAASNRGAAQSAAELGQIRRTEFAASCKVLGVSHNEIWDYRDSQLEFANFSQTAGRLVARIREFKPNVVLTFGSNEGTLREAGPHRILPSGSLVRSGTSTPDNRPFRRNCRGSYLSARGFQVSFPASTSSGV